MKLSDKIKVFSGERSDLRDHLGNTLNAANSAGHNSSFGAGISQTDVDKFITDIKQAQTTYIGNSTTTTTGLTGIVYPSLGSMGHPLTQEEVKELNDLEQQQALATKMAKLGSFKALPREFRQSIINILLWDEALQEMNAAAPESNRLRDLRMRNVWSPTYSQPFYNGHITSSHTHLWPQISSGLRLPEGVSKEDLMTAHLDASLEEEISNDNGSEASKID